MIYAEFALAAWAARRVGRPVKWICERHELFLSDYQARDLAAEAELALDAHGNFLAMRGANLGNLGGHSTNFSMVQKGVEIMSSIYRVPAAHFRARAVLSNSSPTRPYRSAGRPEVIFVIERLIDVAAREFGFDRVELRRRNLVTAAEMPYKNPFGMEYDSGDYPAVMASALKLADWAGFPRRRAEAKKRGKRRGMGVANYVDTASGVPREKAEITVLPEGAVEVVIGITSQGQGHETSFAQLVTEWLGVPIECVRFVTGDTDRVSVGGGAHSGRGMRLGSIVIKKSSDDVVAKGGTHRRAAFGNCRRRYRVQERPLHRQGHQSFRSACSRSRAPRSSAPTCRQDLQGPLAAACDETVRAGELPLWLPRLRGRSRPGNRRDRPSSAMPQSTTSDLPSTR